MSGARVGSIDVLKSFKLQLIKFAEASVVALGDAESEMHRTLMWLELEALAHWTSQIRKRTEALSRAQEALRQKQIFKDASGRQSSAVDEMKAVAVAKRRLEEANEKLQAVKVYSRRLTKEIELYKGGVQRFTTTVQADIPVWAARLERMTQTLESYVALTTDDVSRAASEEFSREMSRAAAEAAGFGMPSAEAAAVAPIGTDYAALRQLTPPGHLREAAGPAFMSSSGWGVRPLGQQDRATMGALPGERLAFDPADTIVVGRGTVPSPTIYLERVEGRGPGDSQWYVGPAVGQPVEGVDAVVASDFVAVRSDLAEAMTLPKGTLVVVANTGVIAVLDADDRNVWPAEPVGQGAARPQAALDVPPKAVVE